MDLKTQQVFALQDADQNIVAKIIWDASDNAPDMTVRIVHPDSDQAVSISLADFQRMADAISRAVA